MKEALQLVKQELGPEAIILSAKDNKKSFGLAGRGSIEITAAISEKSLQNRKYAESHMAQGAKDKFRDKSAKHQRAFIENTVTKYQQRQTAISRASLAPETFIATASAMKRAPTNRRYIDIHDDEAEVSGRRVEDVLEEFAKSGSYVLEDSANHALGTSVEVQTLRKEVDSLRTLLGQFQLGNNKKTITQHPGAEFDLPFELSSNFEKLQTAGMDPKYIVEILEKANEELSATEKKKKTLVDAWVARYILSHTHVAGSWLKPGIQNQVHLFVGPGGNGKTSALVKMASHLVLSEKKKVAVLSCDTFKVGAADQLKIYCQILNLPFETVKHAIEFPKILQRYANCDAILVDYPGFSLKDIGEIDQIRALIPQKEIAKITHLVLNCGVKDLDTYEICHRYQVTHFDDILVTKLDESYLHGFLYNVQRKTEKPLYAFGIGQKIPEDLELATRERVLDLIYKITKRS